MTSILQRFQLRAALIVMVCLPVCRAYSQKELSLWYTKPAAVWTEALPVGNGRLGGMVFGGVADEIIQLNESTLWSGGPVRDNVNPASPGYLQPLRNALFASDYAKANELAHKMQGLFSESYLPLGDLVLKQSFTDPHADNYYRDLDIQDAVSTTKYTVEGVNYKREVFISAPDNIMVVRVTADKKKSLNLHISVKSQLRYRLQSASNTLILKGKAPAHVEPSYYNPKREPVVYSDTEGCRGMRFEMQVKAVAKEGHTVTDTTGIVIRDASEVILYLSAATSFNGYNVCPDKNGKDEHLLAASYLEKAAVKEYPALLKDHLDDFHKYFNRVSLQLGDEREGPAKLPTDERLEAYRKSNEDHGLEALYFQYGRYLLISSSRTPNVPANLQGIWNKELRAPWSSNYTTNINVQMNYWPAESANLSEMHLPLFGLLRELAVTGKKTAREFYGISKGWVVNHNSDIWAMSNPVGDIGHGDPQWANWPMGANWLTRHLWEHYLYTGDVDFLRNTAYPLMKGAAEFSLQWMILDATGHWVTAPSTSPENDFYDGKKKASISVASTMDMSIIRDLFHNTIAAGKVLGIDKRFADTLLSRLDHLYPYQTGSKGQLQEWYKDFEDVDPHHRHTSHLYALHPAHEISPLATPELAQAARKTLELRGDDGTGWSLAWKINFWARLLDGDHAYLLFKNLLRLTRENSTQYGRGGGAYPNLFDAHPPFQIDGNFAGTAGVIEMLLQSQNNEIHLLPALPAAWKQGKVTGLVARGNFVVDITWRNASLTASRILSRNGGMCIVRTSRPVVLKGTGTRSQKSSIGEVLTFNTIAGKVYEVVDGGSVGQ